VLRAKKTMSNLARRVITTQLLDTLVAEGVVSSRKAARKLLVGQLTAISGTIDSGGLGGSLDTSAFASEYASITLSELAAVVTGLAAEGRISSSDVQVLTGDLANAQVACSDPTQRTAAILQFITDAAGVHASASDAAFLRFAAQPLTASALPASSCQ
jgi:hypothetical protein